MMVSEPHDLPVESTAEPVEMMFSVEPDAVEIVPVEVAPVEASVSDAGQDVQASAHTEIPSLLDAVGIDVAWDDEVSPTTTDAAEDAVDAPQMMQDELDLETVPDVAAVCAEVDSALADRCPMSPQCVLKSIRRWLICRSASVRLGFCPPTMCPQSLRFHATSTAYRASTSARTR